MDGMAHKTPWLACAVVVISVCSALVSPPQAGAQQTAWQRSLFQNVSKAAEQKSIEAQGVLAARLEDAGLRAKLSACGAGAAAALPTAALLDLIRREVAVAEVVSGFPVDGGGFGFSMKEAMKGPPFFESGWEVGVQHNSSFNGGKGWWTIQDDVEQKLYGLRPFSKQGEPKTMEEASERAPYCLVNLNRVDAGSPIYGDVSAVFSSTLMTQSSVVSPVDTGGWTWMCNSSRTGYPPYNPNCSAYKKFVDLGTLKHFDHLFLTNDAYWGKSLDRTLCRLLAPWGQPHVAGSDLIHYWEALPAAQVPFPHGVKFLIGSFPSLFGTAAGSKLQEWCAEMGWVLVWSLGLNLGQARVDFWSAAYLNISLPMNNRLADPLALVRTSAAANITVPSAVTDSFREAWKKAKALRVSADTHNSTVSSTTWAASWKDLAAKMPGSLHLEPLRAGACSSNEDCIGITAGGDCMCYHGDEAVMVV